jgi:hypothetical protein
MWLMLKYSFESLKGEGHAIQEFETKTMHKCLLLRKKISIKPV